MWHVPCIVLIITDNRMVYQRVNRLWYVKWHVHAVFILVTIITIFIMLMCPWRIFIRCELPETRLIIEIMIIDFFQLHQLKFSGQLYHSISFLHCLIKYEQYYYLTVDKRYHFFFFWQQRKVILLLKKCCLHDTLDINYDGTILAKRLLKHYYG